MLGSATVYRNHRANQCEFASLANSVIELIDSGFLRLREKRIAIDARHHARWPHHRPKKPKLESEKKQSNKDN